MAIISLTSIPPRFAGLGPVLERLVEQSWRVEEVRLYLPRRYRRFPDFDGSLPPVPRGVRVIRVEDDLGPASKVLHAAEDLRGSGVPILFCDDDRIYPRGWARKLLRAHRQRRDCAVTAVGRQLDHLVPGPLPQAAYPRFARGRENYDFAYRRARIAQQWRERSLRAKGPKPWRNKVVRAGCADILLGYGGALVLPEFVDAPFFDLPEHLWTVDDMLLSGHLARRGVPIWVPRGMKMPQKAATERVEALHLGQFQGRSQLELAREAIGYFRETYGVWQAGTTARSPSEVPAVPHREGRVRRRRTAGASGRRDPAPSLSGR